MNIFIIRLLVIILLLLPGISQGSSISVSGLVSGNWDVDTVKVIGDIEIREAKTLTIEPGVIIEFQGEYHFDVNGCLKAVGLIERPIIFTIADTTGFYNDTIPDGGWKSIRIENLPPTVDSIIFNYCHFTFGKAVDIDSTHSYGGAICARNTNKIRISNCTFQNNYSYFNGGAVFLERSNALIGHNNFTNNNAGIGWNYYGYGGGLCTDWGTPIIRNNTFYQNSSTGIAGGLCARYTDCPVYNNIFDNNFSALGGGFGILHIDTCQHIIANNLVINNGAAFFGAGISNNNCSPTYINNTIANNHCQGGGGGFYCKDSVVPKLYNNILFGNTQYGGENNQVYLWDLLSQPDFYYNNIEGGSIAFAGTGGSAYSGVYENNINTYPEFESNGTSDFALKYDSPCVDAGTLDISGFDLPEFDLAGKLRIINEKIDIGAFENQSLLGIDRRIIPEDGVFYPPSPNPTTDFVQLSFFLKENSEVNLTLIDLKRKFIKSLVNQIMPAGSHQVSWDISNNSGNRVVPGVYFAKLKVGNTFYHQKIMVK